MCLSRWEIRQEIHAIAYKLETGLVTTSQIRWENHTDTRDLLDVDY